MNKKTIDIITMSYENPSIATKENQRERVPIEMLARLRKLVRNFMITGVMIGGYGQTANLVFEYRAQGSYQRVEDLKKAESELENVFGSYASLKPIKEAEELKEILNREKKEYWNVLKSPPGFFRCPLCGRQHLTNYSFCPTTGEKLTPDNIKKLIMEEEESRSEKSIRVTNINTKDGGITERKTRDYLKTLPSKWVYSVKSIVQSRDKKRIHYEGLKDQYALASTIENDEGAEIRYYSNSKSQPLDYVINSLAHEIAHANDWDNNHISYEDRLDLLLKISKRINAENRYQSDYVKSIKGDNLHKTNYDRATEYWAEISEQYFSDSTKLNFEDFRIVDEYIHRVDPKYNWRKSLTSRLALVEKIHRDLSRVNRATYVIPDTK